MAGLDEFVELERILLLHNSAPASPCSSLEDEFGPMCEDVIKQERKAVEAQMACGPASWTQITPSLTINVVQVEPKGLSVNPQDGPSAPGIYLSDAAPQLLDRMDTRHAHKRGPMGGHVLYRMCLGRDKLFEEFESFVYEQDASHDACKGSTDSKRSDFCVTCRRLKRILVNRKMRFNKNPTSMHVAKKYLTPLREAKQSQHYQDELKCAKKKIMQARKRVEAIQALLAREAKRGGLEEAQRLIEHMLEDLC